MMEAKKKADPNKPYRKPNSERRDIRSEDPPNSRDIYDHNGNKIGHLDEPEHIPGPSGLY